MLARQIVHWQSSCQVRCRIVGTDQHLIRQRMIHMHRCAPTRCRRYTSAHMHLHGDGACTWYAGYSLKALCTMYPPSPMHCAS